MLARTDKWTPCPGPPGNHPTIPASATSGGLRVCARPNLDVVTKLTAMVVWLDQTYGSRTSYEFFQRIADQEAERCCRIGRRSST